MDKYEILNIVGEGMYGDVYKCKNKETGEYVAIKKFKGIEDELIQKTMKREYEMLKLVKHENIVEFKEGFIIEGNTYLVFEYIEKNLLEIIEENKNGLNENLIKNLIYQLIKAIIYLHQNNIIHRDIKPENILIDKNKNLKLCDFGFARKYYNNLNSDNNLMTDYIATRWYRAPEILLSNGKYGFEVDFWAIGCLMCELIDGKPIFPGKDEIDQINCISKILGNFNESDINFFCKENNCNKNDIVFVDKVLSLNDIYKGKISNDGIDFIKQLLKVNPKERLNEKNVFLHKYYCNYNKVNKNNFNLNFNKENNKLLIEDNQNIKTVKDIKKEFSFPINSSRKKIKKLFVQNKIIDQKDSPNLILYHSLSQRNINNNIKQKKSESFNLSKVIKQTSSNNLKDKKIINDIIPYHYKDSTSNKNLTNKNKLKSGFDFFKNQNSSQNTIFGNNNINFALFAFDNSFKKKNKFQKNKSARNLNPSYCYQMKKNFKNENEDFQNFLREKKRNTSNIENQKDKFLREKLVNENKNIKISNYNTNNKLPYIVYYNGDFLRNKIKSLKKKNSI